MIEKRKLYKFAIASLVFAGVAFWLYSSLLGAYRRFELNNSLREALLFSISVPAINYVDDWVAEVPSLIQGGRVLVLGMDENHEFYPIAGNELARVIWEARKDSVEFDIAFQNVYFLLPYTFPRNVSPADLMALSGIPPNEAQSTMRLFLLPIPDESGFFISGAILMAVPIDNALAYERLLRNLFLLAWILFTVIFGVAILSRDPITGFSVIFLFAMSAAFIAFPLLEALRLTFVSGGVFSFNVWKEILQPHRLVSLFGSIQLGVFTATVSCIVGFIFAFLVERTNIRGRKFISTMGILPIISPPFSLSLSIILLLGNNGLISRQLLGLQHFSIYGLGGLVMVQTVGLFPIAFMTISSILKSIDSTMEEAALDLRATRLKTFITVTLPLAVPGILSAWLLVFTASLADFANPLLLGGSYRVLSVEAFIEVTGRNNMGNGAALSLLLLLPSLIAFFSQRCWVNKKSVVTVTGKPSARMTELATKPVRIILTVFVALCIAFIFMLYGTIVAGCFVRNWGIDFTFTLENIGEALFRGRQSIVNTLTLAVIATPIIGIISMAAALILVRQTFFGKRLLEALLMTPFAIPGTLMGISYILAFNKPPILLVGTAAILVINYVVRETPVGLETGSANLRQIDKSIEEAAQDLGANMPKVFTSVVLPIVRPSFLTAMSYAFVRSMTTVNAVIFLISARWHHLTVQIFSFAESLQFGLASVLSTVLILIVLAVFGLMRLLVKDRSMNFRSISSR